MVRPPNVKRLMTISVFGYHHQLTPLTKLGELGSELVYNCVLMSKTEVQVKDEIKTCYFHGGFTKKVQVMSIKSSK